MLPRTLLFLPGIGPVRELRLWRRGVESWTDYRALASVRGIRPRLKERHNDLLLLAERALGRDAAFFSRLLPPGEHWRAYSHFREGAAFLDIETTGDRSNQITIVGVRHKGESRTFVKGVNYTPEAVSRVLRDATALVTFNGASFDLPVLAAEGVSLPAAPSVDLRPVFHRAGYEGGLKRIEEQLGFLRPEHVRGMSGYDAVKLWRRYSESGDEDALALLLDYNIADFENLEPLAEFACAALEKRILADLNAQTRLPVGPSPAAPAGP